MRLKENWRDIAGRAWSFRLGLIAGLFSGLEVILPLFVDSVPRNLFALLSFVTVMGAVVARLVAQPKANL